jgi:quinone-modifying oxidoreductase subunit QmoC
MATVIHPDTAFLREVMAFGGGDLKKCFQCATCSATCELSPEDAPFPRKQIMEAQWGLKDRVLADPAIWLCYGCGDCTARCPRGARPGDIMGALRRMAIKRLAFPRLLGEIVSTPSAWPALFLIPAVIFLAILVGAPKGPPTPELEFANLFPIPVLEALFFTVSALVAAVFVVGAARFGVRLRSLPQALVEAGAHRRFGKCGEEKPRRLAHLLTFWGFLGLAFVGTAVGIGTMVGVMRTPLALANPWKILANMCAVVALVGVTLLIAERSKKQGTWFDWFFLGTLGGVVATGILSQLLRLAQTRIMYPVYFVHLVLILALFLYAPYSKFAHMVYRTLALACTSKGEN